MRAARGLVATCTVVWLFAGCSSGASKPKAHAATTAAPTASTSVPAAAPPATGASTTSSSAPPTTSPAGTAASARCATGVLSVTLTTLGAAAGTEFLELGFKNTSTRSCTMQGYPGVSFVDAQGHQIGAAVKRMNGADGPVTVAPGATVGALVAYHDVVVTADCQPLKAAGLRVYPPNETASVVVATNLMVCANLAFSDTAGVSPVTTPGNLHP